MNYYPVTDRRTDGQTDRKRCIWAHRAICTGGLKNCRSSKDSCNYSAMFVSREWQYTDLWQPLLKHKAVIRMLNNTTLTVYFDMPVRCSCLICNLAWKTAVLVGANRTRTGISCWDLRSKSLLNVVPSLPSAKWLCNWKQIIGMFLVKNHCDFIPHTILMWLNWQSAWRTWLQPSKAIFYCETQFIEFEPMMSSWILFHSL